MQGKILKTPKKQTNNNKKELKIERDKKKKNHLKKTRHDSFRDARSIYLNHYTIVRRNQAKAQDGVPTQRYDSGFVAGSVSAAAYRKTAECRSMLVISLAQLVSRCFAIARSRPG